MYQKDRPKDFAAGADGPTGGTKPFENPAAGAPSSPPGPAPEGYEWQFQPDPSGQSKGWWILAAAAVGAIGSYLSAQQANKPRSGYTDQTTTQTPYMEGTIRPDIEAILNFQRSLINQGPNYVGDRRFWPTSPAAPQPGFAPGPLERSDTRDARLRQEAQEWLAANGNPGRPDIRNDPFGPTQQRDKADEDPVGASASPERLFGGWTAEELEADPTRVSKLGTPGTRKYNRYRRRHPLEDMSGTSTLPFLRSVFMRGT